MCAAPPPIPFRFLRSPNAQRGDASKEGEKKNAENTCGVDAECTVGGWWMGGKGSGVAFLVTRGGGRVTGVSILVFPDSPCGEVHFFLRMSAGRGEGRFSSPVRPVALSLFCNELANNNNKRKERKLNNLLGSFSSIPLLCSEHSNGAVPAHRHRAPHPHQRTVRPTASQSQCPVEGKQRHRP